ncbi:NAD(P)H-dependent FMN reductase [Sulfitobacter undariae]|uniref:NAD(P)H-dependent FMN reductase n=1 Tax=Sulfitobacter undariae TaxID=1563671 RepID=A0A7W6E4R4_9RHOB|nr:NADPH-dependent FMN reductase [Sulfitobacter undariae]MBB3994716.1 NAD(P)H-dependent FMN reductase [Sulfitobacter undariae]
MKILAISGSTRAASTNTAMLNAVAQLASNGMTINVYSDLASLPVFNPDAEVEPLPESVNNLITMIKENDGIIISSPEYVRAIPGGLKNAIDWLVSRDEIIGKPIALMHASHRGDDMLAQLRLVLSTVSDGFTPQHFLRLKLMNVAPEDISHAVHQSPNCTDITKFLNGFASYLKSQMG